MTASDRAAQEDAIHPGAFLTPIAPRDMILPCAQSNAIF